MAKSRTRRDRKAADRGNTNGSAPHALSDDELRRELVRRFGAGSLLAPPNALPPNRQPATEMLTGDDFRKSNTYTIELPTRPGKLWRLRKVEAFDLFMRGIISTPLIGTIEKLSGLQQQLKADPQAWKTIDDTDKSEVMQVLRAFAKAVVVAPVLTEIDDGDPAHCPISLLTFWDLFAIMNASPNPNRAPILTEASASSFRGEAPRVDDHAALSRENLRGSAERLPADAGSAVERQ